MSEGLKKNFLLTFRGKCGIIIMGNFTLFCGGTVRNYRLKPVLVKYTAKEASGVINVREEAKRLQRRIKKCSFVQ